MTTRNERRGHPGAMPALTRHHEAVVQVIGNGYLVQPWSMTERPTGAPITGQLFAPNAEALAELLVDLLVEPPEAMRP